MMLSHAIFGDNRRLYHLNNVFHIHHLIVRFYSLHYDFTFILQGISRIEDFSSILMTNLSHLSATTHILPVSSPENSLLQQQKPTSSTQTSQQQQQQQQMAVPSLMNQAGSSQNSQSNQQTQEQNYFTTAADTQHTDSQQMTSSSISATSPVQMPQNGYASSINSSNVQSTQSFSQQQQQQCIGGAQAAAWTARGSNTLTYTQSMQPPDSRAINQNYCKFCLFNNSFTSDDFFVNFQGHRCKQK